MLVDFWDYIFQIWLTVQLTVKALGQSKEGQPDCEGPGTYDPPGFEGPGCSPRKTLCKSPVTVQKSIPGCESPGAVPGRPTWQ